MKKYADIEEWLKSGKAETYDFVEDTDNGSEKDFGEIENPYEKFLIYKLNTSKERKPNWNILNDITDEKEEFSERASAYSVDDPDLASVLLQEIYKELWPDLVKERFMRQTPDLSYMKQEDGMIAASDTMTSAMVRFTDAMSAIIDCEIKDDEDDKSKKKPKDDGINDDVLRRISKIHHACGHNQKWWSKNFSIIVAAALGEEFYGLIKDKYHCMHCFLDKIHTIGNYCPVPEGFNGARSGGCASHDYWDLTLMKIYEWYCFYDNIKYGEVKRDDGKVDIGKVENRRDNLIQEELLHGNGYALNCIRWLKTFGEGKIGWRNFIDTLFLQDYVYAEKDEEHDYYEPKPFWEGHNWDKKNLKISDIKDAEIEKKKEKEKKKTDEEIKIEIINERLQAIVNRIYARSVRIVDALKNRQLKEVHGELCEMCQ